MKKKFLALVLTLAMVLSLVPMTALATEGGQEDGETSPAGSTIYVDVNSVNEGNGSKDNPYKSLVTAVNEATSGDTIQLAEGTYTLYKGGANVLQKDLTFVGSGTNKTTWLIGPKVPNPEKYGTEYNSDYSFDVRGTAAKETVTFKDMTLQSGKVDYLGFAGTDNTVVEGCVIEGKTFYWGYTSAEFRNTTFICPPGDYALWTYSSPIMTFDGCRFNSSGKVINVYTDYDAGKHDITVNFKNCTVNSTAWESLSVMNINDSNMGSFKYVINFSGVNTVNGIKADGIESTDGSHASTAYNTENKKKTSAQATCSKLFEFNMKYGNGNSGKTIVNMDTKPVWKDGKMVSHAIDTANDKYTDGYKDNAFTDPTYGEWTKNPDGTKTREVTKTCKYCGYQEKTTEDAPADPIEWYVSKSKTATPLNTNTWTSDVTLSLPSAEEKLASDVVFVLDKSSCKEETAKKAEQMLTELQEEVKENKSNIQIGVVVFGGDAKVSYPLSVFPTTEDTLGELTKALTTKPENLMGGSNMHAGLLAAQEMLKDSGTDKNRQYVILVSDGLTRLFTGSDGKTKDIYYQYTYLDKTGEKQVGTEEGQISPKDCVYFGMIDEWTQVRTKISDNAGSRPIPYNTWESYFNKVEEWVKKDTDTYALDYETYGNDPTDKVKDKSTGEIIDPNFKYIGHNDYENHAMSVDRAVYEAYNTFTGMVDSGNHCYAVLPGSGTDFGKAFMSAMNSYAGNTDSVDFNKIGNDILYAVGAGSVVEDKMGSAFDFCGLDTLTLTLLTKDGKETQLARKIEGNTAYFGDSQDALTANTYRFKVEYKSDQDAFTWTINENVSNFTHVQLTYTVKLTKPETAAGTYGQTDLDGDTFIDGTQTQTKVDAGKALYTNQSATLVPVNSAGETGRPLFFPMPSVSYTIKGSSGGHSGGGTITIPDDVPTGLNGKDHYAYVVGYPDGMVYPQKNITRAEVATIFFRLLEDETREANMTKSNGYNDMKDGAWYTCAVSTLSKMGIIKGYEDGSFKPDASISRAEFAAIAARFDPDGDKTPATFSDVSSHWAKDEISIAANHGWIKGYEDGSFKPDQKITRAETMTLVNRVLKRLPETKDDLHKDMKTWPDNQNESAWFYLAVQEATNSHYQKLKKDGIHETWESMRETRDWAALEK